MSQRRKYQHKLTNPADVERNAINDNSNIDRNARFVSVSLTIKDAIAQKLKKWRKRSFLEQH